MSFEATRVIADESARFAEALRAAKPDAPVPTCPGWNADDLLWHLTEVQLFWASVLSSGATTDEQIAAIEEAKPPRPTRRADLLARRARATEDLISALLTGPMDAPAWSWFPPDQTVGFTERMQTHEATMHRIDAELTAGLPVSPIAPDVAAAGIDHVLDVMWNWVPESADRRSVGTVELRATDAEPRTIGLYRWSGSAWGQPFVDQIAGRRAAPGAEPDAVVEGPAELLDRLVWSRPADGLLRQGDASALAALDALIAFGIQ